MTTDEALAEVCRHFCSATGDVHDDACIALRAQFAPLLSSFSEGGQ